MEAEHSAKSLDATELCLELHESDLECSICHDFFTDPKLLPCAHVICRQCLLSWLSTNHEATCPLCRCAIAKGKKLKSAPKEMLEKVVSELPDDVAMTALVENTRLLHADHMCVGCRQQQAMSICLYCGDMLCETCTATHRNLTATKHHKVESLSTMTAEKLSRSQPASCCVHPDRPSELFCATHAAIICHLCASSVHRACPEVTLFEQRLQELSQKLTAVSNQLQTDDKTLEHTISELDSKVTEAEKKTNKALAEIDEACSRVEKAVEACRTRLSNKAVKARQAVTESVQEAKANLLTRRGRIAAHRRLVDRMQLTSPPGKLEQASKLIQSFVKTTDVKDASTNNVSAIGVSQVCVDFAVVQRLEKELTFLGEKHQLSVGQDRVFTKGLLMGHIPCFTKPPVESTNTRMNPLEPLEDRTHNAEAMSKVWRFINSPNVCLTCGGKTAERVTGTSAIVFSDTPMATGVLYEVIIDEVRGRSSDTFPCGVVLSNPVDLLKKLPDTALHGWKEAIVFSYSVFVFGAEKDYEIGVRLKRLNEGTRVGFLRDPGGFLHLYIDGVKQWIFVHNVHGNCYVFFDLLHVYKQITCLPPTTIQRVA